MQYTDEQDSQQIRGGNHDYPARDQGDDMEQMMFTFSDNTAKLDAALAKAQGAIESARKDKENPYFNSKYADLAAVWGACRKALSDNGISVTQWPAHSTDDRLHIFTRIAHSGEWMQGHFSVPVGKKDAQGYVASTTYARRAALAAAVGVAPDDDDDGEAAVGRGGNAAVQSGAKAAPKAKAKEAAGSAKENAARTFVQQAIDEIGAAKDEASVFQIWDETHREKIERVKGAYPDLYALLEIAYHEKMATFNVMAAG